MREIKFRAWYERKNKMYYRDFGVSDYWYADNDHRGWETQDLAGELSEWMQFTGLKDKNGREIYEGDIVEWDWLKHKLTATVIWDEERAMFSAGDRRERLLASVVILGNIYENPELLAPASGGGE